MLAIRRGDGSRDDFLRYPKKMDVEDQPKSESFRDGDKDEDEDGWRSPVRDDHLDMVQERTSISREEAGTLRRNEEQVVVETDGLETKDGRNDCSSPKVDALEDKHDSLKASSDKEVGFCSSESVKREDGDESLKQYDPMERVNKDEEEEQVVLERDEKVLGSVSRDNEESGSGSPERDDRDLGKDGEDLVLRQKNDDPQTQVDNTAVIGKIEMREVTGQQDSPDAVKSAGETSQNVYFSGPVLPQTPSQGHRRAQSEIGTPGHRRTNSFQKLKTQMQKAWRGVSNLRDDNRPTFNPEVLANQKRQWYQLHSSKALLVFNLSLSLFLDCSIKPLKLFSWLMFFIFDKCS